VTSVGITQSLTTSITTSITKEAIALLIDLAESGEIDPWDVQVIDVVDRFLSRLISDDRRDLYESGQALLYASMLVLLKAQTLSQSVVVPLESVEEFLDETSAPARLSFDDVIKRRPVAIPPVGRKTTLAELIAQLEEIAQTVGQKVGKRSGVSNRNRPQSRQMALRAIAQLAHKENLAEMAIKLETFFFENPHPTDINELTQIFGDRVGVFTGLLFLSAQTKVELIQTDFYGQIQVQPYLLS
jgi:segregation and condensation protein A